MTHYINPMVAKRQLQIIKGTILGGSSLVKPTKGRNCYLSMRGKNAKWIDYKASELSVYSSLAPFTLEKTNRWHSLCYPIFSEMREMFYDGKKRCLNPNALDDLQDIAFMIWYGDAGHYKNNSIILNTNIWGKKGTEVIGEYFNLLNYNCIIFKNRESYRIRLDEDSSLDLLKKISPHFPHFFNH
ncbi:MAG: hypothetical protein DWQ19_12090 [Crenarchaeota archaeon]|nr:MAG: hypothetical protein DWQ19_12090 [Thermoproteota archaeon]